MLHIISASLVLPLIVQFFLLILAPSTFLYWTILLGVCFVLLKYFPINKKIFLFESLVFCFLFLVIFSLGQHWIHFHPSGEHIRDYSLLSASIANPLNPNEPWMSLEANHYYIYWYKWAASLSYLFKLDGEKTYVLSFCLSFALYIKVCYLFLNRIMNIKRVKAFALSLLPSFISNFEGIFIVFKDDFNWWAPSRVINGAITEFPFWTFLQGDYHPHFPSLSLSIVFLYLGFSALKLKAPRYNRLVYLSLLFVVFYRVYMIANPWDVIFLAISFSGIILKEFFFKNDHELKLNRTQNVILLLIGFLLLLSTFLYPPLLQTNIKFSMVTKDIARSTFKELWSHWGLWFITLIFLIPFAFIHKKFKQLNSNHVYFFILSFLLIFLPEIIFLDDPYEPPHERMNFIFKMYMPAWTMIGIFVTICMEKILSQKIFWFFFISLFFVGNFFNYKIIPHRIKQYTENKNRLDFADHEQLGIKNLILKFREFPRGVAVQSSKSAYDYTSFIATLSDKDLYLGWINHLMIFVPDYSTLMNRQSLVRAIYEEADCLKKKEYLNQIQAQYLVLSMQEKKDYPITLSTDFSCLKKIISENESYIFQAN